jgi:cysteinyl-tRNA synthetase
MTFYGKASEMGDLARVARTYRIIVIDADPGMRNFTDAQIAQLRAGGRNRVISYMNLGSCETFRTYWSSAPTGLLSCSANADAQRGAYEGYPDETWMDVGNPDYQALVLEHVAPRIAARVDGFYLDNLELLEHPASSSNGPCTAACRQGGLDLVRKLREKYPWHLLIMQNATSNVTRLGVTGGIPFPLLLDGVAHEEVYAPTHDEGAEAELVAWSTMGLSSRERHRFWIGVEDYVGNCRNTNAARASAARARSRGFSPWASDESSGQRVVCFWD